MTLIRRFVRRVLTFLDRDRRRTSLRARSRPTAISSRTISAGRAHPRRGAPRPRAFRGVEAAKDAQRDARSFAWLEDARRDVRYAVRACSPTIPGSLWPSS